ncbi:MAG: hypothetical protein ACJATK_001189 [Paracoccaceae bacterium]|jgi:uncharacterized protein YbaP (TraB family)
MKILLSLLLALSMTSITAAIAKAPVWKVSKGDDYLYLGGTIHVLSKNDYPLPQAFEIAYNRVDGIVLETDAAALVAPEVQGRILNVMSYQDHRALSNVLDRDTYSQLDQLLKSKGIPIAVFDRFTPAGAIMALTQFELQKLGFIGDNGVDAHFGARAMIDKKESLFLESFEQQLSFIQSMNQLEPNLLIKSGINDIEQLETVWAELLSAWRNGDLDQLEKIGIVDMKRDFPTLYQTILVKRNDQWFDEIKAMILSEDKEFILVGALHMAGSDGLITRLKAAGYTVSQLD